MAINILKVIVVQLLVSLNLSLGFNVKCLETQKLIDIEVVAGERILSNSDCLLRQGGGIVRMGRITNMEGIDPVKNRALVKTVNALATKENRDMCGNNLNREVEVYKVLMQKGFPRFIREFRAFGTFGSSVIPGPSTLITDYVGKISLEEYLSKKVLAENEKLVIATRLIEMLVVLYYKGVIHNNVQPQFIMLDMDLVDGSDTRIEVSTNIYLIDFSAALFKSNYKSDPLDPKNNHPDAVYTRCLEEFHDLFGGNFLKDIRRFLYVILWLYQGSNPRPFSEIQNVKIINHPNYDDTADKISKGLSKAREKIVSDMQNNGNTFSTVDVEELVNNINQLAGERKDEVKASSSHDVKASSSQRAKASSSQKAKTSSSQESIASPSFIDRIMKGFEALGRATRR